jgi:TorA maturation chaperone TorD
MYESEYQVIVFNGTLFLNKELLAKYLSHQMMILDLDDHLGETLVLLAFLNESHAQGLDSFIFSANLVFVFHYFFL